jgi:hypothetical protein
VILERTDGAFGGVATVEMGRGQLEIDLVGRHEGLESRRRLVVQTLELWLEATLGEEGVGALVGGQDLGTGLALHEFNVNCIAVVVVQDEHVRVAGTRGSEKTARLIGVDLTGDALVRGEDMVGAASGGSDWSRAKVERGFMERVG